MLSHEWHELEMLSDRIAETRARCEAARLANNVGQLQAMQKDLADAARQREQLVRHISARLTALAA